VSRQRKPSRQVSADEQIQVVLAVLKGEERVLDLDDLRADRGVMDVVDADNYVIGAAPAPIAVVTDNGPCFRGVTFADALAGDDPLFRHLRVEVNLFRHTDNTLRPHQALDERTPRAAYLAVEHCD
jgi:putative transposase